MNYFVSKNFHSILNRIKINKVIKQNGYFSFEQKQGKTVKPCKTNQFKILKPKIIIINQASQQQTKIITQMFGSTLNYQSVHMLQSHLVASFGSNLYIFKTENQLCIGQIDIGHQADISSLSIQQAERKWVIHSVALDGLYIKCEIESLEGQEGELFKTNCILKQNILNSGKNKKQNSKIISSVILKSQKIFLIDQKHKLHLYNIENSALSNISYQKSFSRLIKDRSEQYVFIMEQNQQKVSIYSNSSQSVLKDYEHTCGISSVACVGENLVVGDARGKITLLYNFVKDGKGKGDKGNKFSSVLQWHTGPVLSLCSNGQYLYSAGEQSVVVLWHMRDLSRDFLPRVRTAITHLSIQPETNQIICSLSDNTIKVIDLSRDKQTYTYKTIIDPKGYAPLQHQPRFSINRTSFRNGVVCLDSLPGKLQFINIAKNGENTQLEIIPRNLINSINGDKVAPNRINSFCFSADWQNLLVSILTPTGSILKFHQSTSQTQTYTLTTKIQSPHLGPPQACLSLTHPSSKKTYFITYSLQDEHVRIWSEHQQAKKSIVDAKESFWRCGVELGYRGLVPKFVAVFGAYIGVVYGLEVVIYQLAGDGSVKVVETLDMGIDIKEMYILEYQIKKSQKCLKLLVVTPTLLIQYIPNALHTQKSPTCPGLQLQADSQTFITQCPKQLAIICKPAGCTNSQIFIFSQDQHKFMESYQCDFVVESAFWVGDRLVLVGGLGFWALDGGQVVDFVEGRGGARGQMDLEQDTMETRLYKEDDIFKLNERWVERQNIKNKKKIQQATQELNLYPNCTSAWQQLASRLFI